MFILDVLNLCKENLILEENEIMPIWRVDIEEFENNRYPIICPIAQEPITSMSEDLYKR